MEIPLRIGFDAKRLFNNFTGLGNYSRTLVKNLATYYPENQYVLFTPRLKKNQETHPFFEYANVKVVQPKTRFSSYWRSYSIKKNLSQESVGIYHGLSHEIPINLDKRKIKSVVTIHDLIFKQYPSQFRPIDRLLYDTKFRYACEHADAIVAISEHTKKDIIRFYNIDSQKIHVIYQTCHDRFKRPMEDAELDALAQEFRLPNEFMLYVGSIIPRKNLGGIIDAMQLLPPDLRIPLVVIGNGKQYKKEILEKIAQANMEHLVLFPNIQFNQLPALYQLAKLFLFPSIYEGFGIPIIEAQYAQTPVITSNVSALPEAGGNGAHYIDPFSPESIAIGIQKILTDNDYAAHLIENASEHVEKFDSHLLSTQLIELYRSIV